MSTASKIVGLLAGISAVAVIGVAVAQGVEPDARIANEAQGAGQQSSQNTSMGETGVPAWEKQMNTAVIVYQPAVAAVETPAPVVAAAPAETTTMGAAPAAEAPAPMEVAQAPVARADRN